MSSTRPLYRLEQRVEGVRPLAFTIKNPDAIEPYTSTGFSWTPEVLSAFREIRDQARARGDEGAKRINLPWADLRFALETSLGHPLLVSQSVELSLADADARARTFAVTAAEATTEAMQVRKACRLWFDETLGAFMQRYKVNTSLRERVEQLYKEQGLFTVAPRTIQPLRWVTSANGTAQPPASPKNGGGPAGDIYEDLASLLLRALSGLELHPRFGRLLPIISRSNSGRGKVELLTRPYYVDGPDEVAGEMAVRVRVSIETIPGYGHPVITIDFIRTRLIRDAAALDKSNKGRCVTGYVFDGDAGRAIDFSLHYDKKNKTYELPDPLYHRLVTTCGLPAGLGLNGLLGGQMNTGQVCARAIYATTMAYDHPLAHGLTPADKSIFFNTLQGTLDKIGLGVWGDWSEVDQAKSDQRLKKEPRGKISLETVLSLLTVSGDDQDEEELTPGQVTLPDIEKALERCYGGGSSQLHPPLKEKQIKLPTHKEVLALNKETLAQVFSEQKPSLVLISEAVSRQQIMLGVAQALFGDAVDLYQAQLPIGAYGPKPEGKVNGQAYITTQAAIWRDTIASVRQAAKGPLFVLVESPWKFLVDGREKPDWDFSLNKTAARLAWASAGCCLQYLNPPDEVRSGKIKLAEYVLRIQSALYDLVFAHTGHADQVSGAAERFFTGGMAERKPRYVVGLQVIAANKDFFEGRKRFIVAVRHDLDTGQTSLRFKADAGITTDRTWYHFPVGLQALARCPDYTLGAKAPEIGRSITLFCHSVISDVAQEDPNALFIVDARHINSRFAWGWLRDTDLDPERIKIGNERFRKESWRGIRIIRCRQDIAPRIITEKVDHFRLASDPNDLILVRRDTSTKLLLRVTPGGASGIPVYLSLAPMTQAMGHFRGSSVFEERIRPNAIDSESDDSLYELLPEPILTKAMAHPRTVEFAVVHAPKADDPDQLIRFVQSLRYGHAQYNDWTSLPSVLHAGGTVSEYAIDFSYEDEENGEATDH